jgi:putative transposase
MGLTALATLADGPEIDNPRSSQRAQANRRLAQRRVARRQRGGTNRRKAVRLLHKAHAKGKNQRADLQPKVARPLVNAYGVSAVEDVHIKGLASGRLAKAGNEAGWAAFIAKLVYNAAEAGRQLVSVTPCGTSQSCLCGAAVPKPLSQRWHQCSACGWSAARDHVAAQLLLGQGLCLLGLT